MKPDPSLEVERKLAERLLAEAQIAAGRLRILFPAVPADDVEETCAEVAWIILARWRRGGLSHLTGGFVWRVCWRKVRRASTSRRARIRREERWQIELIADGGSGRDTDLSDLLATINAALPDSALRTIFPVWLFGERQTKEYAAALGLDVAEWDKAAAEVKRQKDRLMKFLRRNPLIRARAEALRRG